jgi:hypothetical protein
VRKTRYDDRRRKVHCQWASKPDISSLSFFFFSPKPQEMFNQKKKKNQESLHPHKLLHDARSQSLSDFYNSRCIELAAPTTHVQISATNLLQQRSVTRLVLHLLLLAR